MSTTSVVPTQNSTHFYWTQEIWNRAWHSNDGHSMQSLCAKIACIVFPVLLSVAIVEAIQWAWSVFKISADPKSGGLNPQSVKQILPELQLKQEPISIQPTPLAVVEQVEPADGIVANPSTATVALPEVQQDKMVFSTESPSGNPAVELAAPEQVEPADDLVAKNTVTITLPEGSSLYDMVPRTVSLKHKHVRSPSSACVYHALHAAHYAAWGYNLDNSKAFVQFQRLMIETGNREYLAAVEKDPTFKDVVDLEMIRMKDPKFLTERHLYFEPANQEGKPVAMRVQAIVQHLFIPQVMPEVVFAPKIIQIAMLKTSSKQTIALMCFESVVFAFNSHKNEVTLTEGQEATRIYLTKILAPHAILKDGIDQNPFSYSLGQYDSIRK